MIEWIDSYLNDLKNALDAVSKETVQEIAEALLDARRRGARVFVFGNGGSGSTASHWARDLAKGRFWKRSAAPGRLCAASACPTTTRSSPPGQTI